MPDWNTTPLVILLALLLVVTGCLEDYGQARFEATEIQDFNECFGRAFPLEPGFFAARERRKSTGVFLQSMNGGFDADLVYFEVYRPDHVRAQLGQPVALASPGQAEPIVRASLVLRESCPDLYESFYIEGEVIFTELDPQGARLIEGELPDATVVNARTGATVARISGSWRFEVRYGPPYEEFFAPNHVIGEP